MNVQDKNCIEESKTRGSIGSADESETRGSIGSAEESKTRGSIGSNLDVLRRRIETAAAKSARRASDIAVIAVSKTKPLDMILEARQAGINKFGENKAQELLAKIDQLEQRRPEFNAKDIEWHFIGHLQTNKVKQIIGKVKLIHSLDSFELAEAIQKHAAKMNTIVETLVQVNVSKEKSKYGFPDENIVNVIRNLSYLPNIRIRGLMTIAPYVYNPEENRAIFSKLNKIYVDIISNKIDNVCMDVLSAGMSNDFEVAIEEGSNLIWIGTAVFGERVYTKDDGNI